MVFLFFLLSVDTCNNMSINILKEIFLSSFNYQMLQYNVLCVEIRVCLLPTFYRVDSF